MAERSQQTDGIIENRTGRLPDGRAFVVLEETTDDGVKATGAFVQIDKNLPASNADSYRPARLGEELNYIADATGLDKAVLAEHATVPEAPVYDPAKVSEKEPLSVAMRDYGEKIRAVVEVVQRGRTYRLIHGADPSDANSYFDVTAEVKDAKARRKAKAKPKPIQSSPTVSERSSGIEEAEGPEASGGDEESGKEKKGGRKMTIKDALIAAYATAAGANLLWETGGTVVGGAFEMGAKFLRPIGSSLSSFGETVANWAPKGFATGWNVVGWKERKTRESRLGRAAQWVWDAGSNVSRFGLRTAVAGVLGATLFLGGTGWGFAKGSAVAGMEALSIRYSTDGAEARAAVNPTEVGDACKSKLSAESAKAISEAGSMENALGLAMTSLAEAGVDDPEGFLRGKGVLSSGTRPFMKRFSLAEDRGLYGLGLTVKNRAKEALWTNVKGAAVAPGAWALSFINKDGNEVSLSDLQQAVSAFKDAAEPYGDALNSVKGDGDDTGVWDYAKAALRMSEKEFHAAALALMEVTGHKDGFWAAVPSLASAAGYVMYGSERAEDEAVAKMDPKYDNLLGRLSRMSNKVLEAYVDKFDGAKLMDTYSLMEGVGDDERNSVADRFRLQRPDMQKALRPNLQKELRHFFGFSGKTNAVVLGPKMQELEALIERLDNMAKLGKDADGKDKKLTAKQGKAKLLSQLLKQMKLAAEGKNLEAIFLAQA